MRALVTGATGFLGVHLVNALHGKGNFVVSLGRDSKTTSMRLYGSAIIYGDLSSIERIIAEYELDTVIHLAAQTQVSTAVADSTGTWRSNVQGTWQVLEACRKQKVRRVIIASSDKCYGDGPTPYQEDQALRPDGIYATSKACADMIAQSYAKEFRMPIALTRCGNLYGPGHLNWSTLIPGTIRSVLHGERPRLRSNGGPSRDYLFIEDAVDGYIKLAERSEVGAFNFGAGIGVGVLEIVKLIIHLMGMGEKLEPIIGTAKGPVEIQHQVLNYERAKSVLGWQPKTTLEEGLTKTIEWYREYLKGL